MCPSPPWLQWQGWNTERVRRLEVGRAMGKQEGKGKEEEQGHAPLEFNVSKLMTMMILGEGIGWIMW